MEWGEGVWLRGWGVSGPALQTGQRDQPCAFSSPQRTRGTHLGSGCVPPFPPSQTQAPCIPRAAPGTHGLCFQSLHSTCSPPCTRTAHTRSDTASSAALTQAAVHTQPRSCRLTPGAPSHPGRPHTRGTLTLGAHPILLLGITQHTPCTLSLSANSLLVLSQPWATLSPAHIRSWCTLTPCHHLTHPCAARCPGTTRLPRCSHPCAQRPWRVPSSHLTMPYMTSTLPSSPTTHTTE